ncbi:MAG: DUF1343 domain-containing protein [Nitrospiraceae bacterium]|nr:DUF1343 domain-containing protein [Nitrospiraceae bacterium]
MPKLVKTGADLFEKHWPAELKNLRSGLLVHPASVNNKLEHTTNLFLKTKKTKLTVLFGPQHGVRGETQDNMIEWQGFKDNVTGLPVYSLYSQTRKPDSSMLKDIDIMIVDIQDIGSRYYTFIWTMELCMQACLESGKSIVVLDRPNPISGALFEGPVLDPSYSSFVGQRPLPVRHGMTVAEIANYLKDKFYPSLDLKIIKTQGWKRKMWFDDTMLPWVMPSPNIPTLDAATVYPGMCLLEGTNLSEGRGTTRPFEIFGAPFIDPEKIVKKIKEHKLNGVVFRPVYFQPTFQKFSGELCGGAQIHVIDRNKFKPFKTGVAVLKSIMELYRDKFEWKQPPYEYEAVKPPIDILAGTDILRKSLEKNESLKNMEEWWKEQSREFQKTRKEYLIYS